jgi:hypothetical protein
MNRKQKPTFLRQIDDENVIYDMNSMSTEEQKKFKSNLIDELLNSVEEYYKTVSDSKKSSHLIIYIQLVAIIGSIIVVGLVFYYLINRNKKFDQLENDV